MSGVLRVAYPVGRDKTGLRQTVVCFPRSPSREELSQSIGDQNASIAAPFFETAHDVSRLGRLSIRKPSRSSDHQRQIGLSEIPPLPPLVAPCNSTIVRPYLACLSGQAVTTSDSRVDISFRVAENTWTHEQQRARGQRQRQ